MVSCISQYQAWGPDLVGERHEDKRHEEETTTFEKKVEDEDQEEDRSQIFTFNIIFKFLISMNMGSHIKSQRVRTS